MCVCLKGTQEQPAGVGGVNAARYGSKGCSGFDSWWKAERDFDCRNKVWGMSSHFTLAITSAMQSCRSVGPRRYQKPLYLVYTEGLCLTGWGSWARSQGSLQRLKWKVKLFGNIWRLSTHKRAVSSSPLLAEGKWRLGTDGTWSPIT